MTDKEKNETLSLEERMVNVEKVIGLLTISLEKNTHYIDVVNDLLNGHIEESEVVKKKKGSLIRKTLFKASEWTTERLKPKQKGE